MTPPQTPLHALAAQGWPKLADRVANLVNAQPILEFVRREGHSAVNLKPGPLLNFLTTGRRLHVFAWAEEEAARTKRPMVDVLRGRLRRFTDLRIQFEEQAGGGQHFYYGALNVGGMGAPGYGRYCVVDRAPVDTVGPDTVWVAEDTLTGRRFRDSDGSLSWSQLADWISPHDRAAELAALKLATLPGDSRPLAQQICNDDDYIEALSIQPPQLDQVGEVRVEGSRQANLQDRALDALLSGSAPANDLDLHLHGQIRDRTRELGVSWVEVTP